MEFTIQEFKELGLSPNEYMVLYSIVYEDLELRSYIETLLGNAQFLVCLIRLQEYGYIKINEDRSWTPRQKLLSLQAKINPEPEFEEFWDKYHDIVREWNKTDKIPAEKHWKKLTKKEKQLAFDNIQAYYDSLPMFTTGKPVKKARTYLADKNFNDNFKVGEDKKRSLNKMI
jgi:hypothetical protein